MKQVTLEYKRLLRWVKVDLQVPSSWHELTPCQMIAVCRLYLGEGSEEDFLTVFFGIPVAVIRSMDSYHRYKMSELVQWISDCRAPHNTFLIPSLRGGLYAPADKLKGVCLQQFVMADTFFTRYSADERDEDLCRLIACLYLRPDEVFFLDQAPAGRHWWSKAPVLLDVEQRSRELASLDKDIRYAIFLNYILIKNWMSKAYPYLFQEGSSSRDNKAGKPSVNWISIIDSFVGDKVTEYDKFLQMPATTAFRIMNNRIREGMKHGN